MLLIDELKKTIKGEVQNDEETLRHYSTDASIFTVKPQVVVFPKDVQDVKNLVSFVREHKENTPGLSLTARSAGSDMSGGPLTESIVVEFTRHFNHVKEISDSRAVVEPGVFYRDLEKETVKQGLLLPSYPASKLLATLGGMIANNSGGEKTLKYGKTNEYVEELKVVLADGNEYTLKRLSKEELNQKCAQEDFEGAFYKKVYELLENNYDLIKNARPKVSKNSAGYALWDVWDREYFDLTQLFVGSQGTLGLVTEAKLLLVKPKEHKRLAVLFLKDIGQLPDIINAVLPLEPEGLEAFDDNTLKLALRFFPNIARRIKGQNIFSLALQFIPEFFVVLRMLGLPKLVILVQFAEDSDEEAEGKLAQLGTALGSFPIQKRILHKEKEGEKYWVIRRESFALLREHVKGKKTAPFIDDFIVDPDKLPEFLPRVYKILEEYNIHVTLAGHAGSGNFHIIPLMDLKKESERKKIPEVSNKVYDLIIEYGGSITAEHNDGLIRSPYLKKMYGEKVYALFEEVKRIFDPQNIFNPGKKVYSSLEYAMEHIEH